MKTKLSVFCDKIIEAGWLIAIVSVPLFFNIYTARTFEPDKITLLRSIVLVMILAWAISALEKGVTETDRGTSLGERLKEWVMMPFMLPTLLFVISFIISTIVSISPMVSLWGSYQRLQGLYSILSYIVVFMLMAGTLRSREQVDRFVTIVILVSVPISLYGIVQRYGLDPLPWAGDVTRRVASTMGNAIFVASYLIMAMPLTLSRLVKSMTAIIKEEEASWGHTILAAVYIFVLAIQTLTVIFSQSRGPLLGILGGFFVMGLLFVLTLRQLDSDRSALSLKEIVTGLGFFLPLTITSLIGAGVGYALGYGLEQLFFAASYDLGGISVVGLGLGSLIGLIGLYVFMATTNRGWRWLWLSWLGLAGVAIGFILILNARGTPADPYLDPVRNLPLLSRLSNITDTEGGTGRVRTLIWDSAMKLVFPHDPLGIEGDEYAAVDNLNVLRPLLGYGPESMFNAFAYVYPPDLAHVEARGSSADRSHNETMDSLVITGWLGFLAYYYIMVSVFYYEIKWLGWASTKGAKQRLIAFMLGGTILGAVASYVGYGGLTLVPVGMPFGMLGGMVLYVIVQALLPQPEVNDVQFSDYHYLLIGVLGAIIGHFIEVHFVFSIAATYTYFWAYRGLVVAIDAIEKSDKVDETEETEAEETPAPVDTVEETHRRGRRSRRGRRGADSGPAPKSKRSFLGGGRGWQMVVGGQGLTMAIIMVILTFDFITPTFEFSTSDQDSMSLLWMYLITWSAGLAICLSTIAVRRDEWTTVIAWPRAVALYAVSSLSYFFFYVLIHRFQFGQQVAVASVEDVIMAADVLVNGLLVLYIFLFVLMGIFAITLSWSQMGRLTLWRSENWWLYPALIALVLGFIWFKNFNVVRADIYLKEGERYRNAKQWEQAIALHEHARDIDSDEDFYYLMLALDYQLMAQDGRLDATARQAAWLQGEEIALEARNINPYNPDNTGNMGRYYFTLGQVLGREKFQDALDFFEKSATLAPTNVIYHNLWAQTHYILQNYDAAIERLKISTSLDDRYPPTWVLLGDSYAAAGQPEEALQAHSAAMNLRVREDGFSTFADQFLDQRLSFYISSGYLEDVIAEMKDVAIRRPDAVRIPSTIAHTYVLAGQNEAAIPYFEQAISLGDNSPRTLRELANIYLAQQNFEQAVPAYEALLAQSPNDIDGHSALAYMLAQQGRYAEAIQHNQVILQQRPDDYDTLKNLAILYQQNQQWTEALNAALRAQELAPEEEAGSWPAFIATIQSQMGS